MRKRITVWMIVLALLVGVTAGLTGCEKKYDAVERMKYVVFTCTGVLDEERFDAEYRVGSGKKDIEIACDDERFLSLTFRYNVYYWDDDTLYDGPQNKYSPQLQSLQVTKYGDYSFRTYEYPYRYKDKNNKNSGYLYEDCLLNIHVYKPDKRVAPEVVFDPNGGTIEEVNGETRYVYNYTDREPFQMPIMKLSYEDEEIEIGNSLRYVHYVEVNTGERGEIPREPGLYRVNYYISKYDYKEEYKDKYLPVDEEIIVEIRE